MRVYHLAAFVALGYWQVAPARVVEPPPNSFRLAVAAATGQWEDYERTLTCEGDVESERSSLARAGSGGVRADLFTGDGRIRLSGVAGLMTSDSAWLDQGLFWGAMAAVEERTFGAGIGYSSVGGMPGLYGGSGDVLSFSHLSWYVRGGRLDGLYTVGEFHPLSETPSLTGDIRAGLGAGDPRRRQASALVGVVIGREGPSGGRPTAGFADIGLPVGPTLDVLTRAVVGFGHESPHWGLGIGVRGAWAW